MPVCTLQFSATEEQWPICVGDEHIACLHAAIVDWACRDGQLSLRVLCDVPLELPPYEPSEPRLAALARLGQWSRQHGAYLALNNVRAYDAEFYPHLNVCRFLCLDNDEDLQIWDAVLSLGMPMFALRDTMMVELSRPTVMGVLQALLFGAYYCSNGLEFTLDEGPHHCHLRSELPMEAHVIVRGGMEIEQLSGAVIQRDDRGTEGYVRFAISADGKQAWTQPRFVGMPEPT